MRGLLILPRSGLIGIRIAVVSLPRSRRAGIRTRPALLIGRLLAVRRRICARPLGVRLLGRLGLLVLRMRLLARERRLCRAVNGRLLPCLIGGIRLLRLFGLLLRRALLCGESLPRLWFLCGSGRDLFCRLLRLFGGFLLGLFLRRDGCALRSPLVLRLFLLARGKKALWFFLRRGCFLRRHVLFLFFTHGIGTPPGGGYFSFFGAAGSSFNALADSTTVIFGSQNWNWQYSFSTLLTVISPLCSLMMVLTI